jgi:hypothetical protein
VTWNNAAWAIDGATMNSALARLATYAATSGDEGIIQLGDCKVSPLSTPGNGVRVSTGGVVIPNRYLGANPDQSYVAMCETEDVLGPTDMPPSSGSARSHLVVATVGDPQYSQAGHPWMLSSDPPVGDEDTFQYVRTHVIQNVPSTTTRFDQLGLNYPAVALARIDLPASTTTVQSSHIVDLRKVARPRAKEVMWHVNAPSTADPLAVTPLTYEYWPDNSRKAVEIPKWASYIQVQASLMAVKRVGAAQARMRFGSLSAAIQTSSTLFDKGAPYGGQDRDDIIIGGEIYIPPALRGTTQNFEVSATTEGSGSNNQLSTDSRTAALVRMRFVEVAD